MVNMIILMMINIVSLAAMILRNAIAMMRNENNNDEEDEDEDEDEHFEDDEDDVFA